MSDITEDQNIWFPGIYNGREDIYAEPARGFDRDELIVLVQARAQEDGEWSIANNRVGGRPEFMRKMMAWVSDPKNIIQCYETNPDKTVDWICRELANVTKAIGGSRG